jgi:hypothetical protein
MMESEVLAHRLRGQNKLKKEVRVSVQFPVCSIARMFQALLNCFITVLLYWKVLVTFTKVLTIIIYLN